MFPLRGAENDIQNHLLFFIFLGQGPPTADVVGGFCFFILLGLLGRLSFRATLRRFTRFNGF